MKKIRYLLLILLLSFVLFGCNTHKHEYEKNIITPTCTEMGYTIFVCECGEAYKDLLDDMINNGIKNHKKRNKITYSFFHLFYARGSRLKVRGKNMRLRRPAYKL